jgi:hypothetical protein
MRVAIVGSRELHGNEERWYNKICERVPANCTEIVSGGAEGIDSLARRYAEEHGLLLKEFLPEYGRHGKSAAFVRNSHIVEYAHIVLAFWDGKSRGTADTVIKCYNSNKPVEIFL